MMRKSAALAAFFVCLSSAALSETCPGNPDAIGTSRTIVVDPAEHNRIGTMQYDETLPLADKEVVLTFDDGPLPHYTYRILETLAHECVKATFFIVGRMARGYPDGVRRIYNEGHTIGTHSQNHPFNFANLSPERAQSEIDEGIASTLAALGNPAALSPFFRFPGLGRSNEKEGFLAARSLMVWSADFPADDWRKIGAAQVTARALERLERKGKGVLLLHDIQPATVLALPVILRELKQRGYRIVHVEAAGPNKPKTVTALADWVMHKERPSWPRVMTVLVSDSSLPAPSIHSFNWPQPFRPWRITGPLRPNAKNSVIWPDPSLVLAMPTTPEAIALPVPSMRSFGIPHPFGPQLTIAGVTSTAAEAPVTVPEDVIDRMVAQHEKRAALAPEHAPSVTATVDSCDSERALHIGLDRCGR